VRLLTFEGKKPYKNQTLGKKAFSMRAGRCLKSKKDSKKGLLLALASA
jgi:hypothetical protein